MAPNHQLKENKNLNFLKQNRKSTREKYIFLLNGKEIDNVALGTTFYSNDIFSISKQRLVEKARRSIFARRRYLDLINSRYQCAINFSILFSFQYYYTVLRFGALTDNIDPKKWEKDPIERLHSQFYKHYLGLNRRAPNVASRNDMGRLSLKSTIFIKILIPDPS